MYFMFLVLLSGTILWGNTRSSFFTISNSVRQGGILSPKLFFVYINIILVIN